MFRSCEKKMSLVSGVLLAKCARTFGFSSGRLLFPVIWITNRCNLRCVMCDRWKTPETSRGEELDAAQWRAALESFRKQGAVLLAVTGGEPLLRSDIYDILSYAGALGMRTHLCTNGTLIGRAEADKLGRSSLTSISVSLDSHLPSVHDGLRGAGCFDKTVQAVKLLAKRAPDIKLGINCVVSRKNADSAPGLAVFASGLGVKQIKFDVIYTNLAHRMKDPADFKELSFSPDDLPAAAAKIKEAWRIAREKGMLSNSKEYIDNIGSKKGSLARRGDCVAGFLSCAVDPYGRVSACDNMDPAGSITRYAFEDIWKSESMRNQRRAVRTCSQNCWDSTHAELSIRCSAGNFLSGFADLAGEIEYYL